MNYTRALFVLILLGFLLTLPAFYHGIIVSDDILIYSNWHKCFSEQLFSGEWSPRWLVDMNGGRGSPVFFFYPPLPFYFSALFEYLLPENSPGWYALYLSLGLALGLSGFTSFLLLNNYTQPKQAFILSLFYMLAPYHLFIDFYHRFAYPEFWAFTWVPLLLHFLYQMVNGRRKFSIGLAISYALVLLTHLPSFIILSLFILIVLLVIAFDKERVISVIFSLSCGVVLSSFYVLPMLLCQPFVSLNKMWEGRYSLYENFFVAGFGFENNYLLKITIVNFVVITTIFFLVKRDLNKRVVFWLFTGYFSMFLMFRPSSFVWSFIPLLDKIQFPWRLNLITLISVLVLCSAVFNSRTKSVSKVDFFLKGIVITVLASQVFAVLMLIFPYEKHQLSQEEKVRVIHESTNKLGVVEYVPHWASDEIFSEMKLRRLGSPEFKLKASIPGDLSLLTWSPRKIEMAASSSTGFAATISQFYFPYWQATIDNGAQLLDIAPSPQGLIRIKIPPGQHMVTVRLVDGSPEVFGKLLSFFSGLGLVYYLLWNYYKRQVLRQSLLND